MEKIRAGNNFGVQFVNRLILNLCLSICGALKSEDGLDFSPFNWTY